VWLQSAIILGCLLLPFLPQNHKLTIVANTYVVATPIKIPNATFSFHPLFFSGLAYQSSKFFSV
jgi:hypothetical protein